MPRLVIEMQFVGSVYKHVILSGDGLMMVLLETDLRSWPRTGLGHGQERDVCVYTMTTYAYTYTT